MYKGSPLKNFTSRTALSSRLDSSPEQYPTELSNELDSTAQRASLHCPMSWIALSDEPGRPAECNQQYCPVR